MNNYPEVVAKIAHDYLERVKAQLQLVPVRERIEFLREIESHIYEAYQQTPGEDDVARILAVLRNLGEPAEVVSDRLPGTMVRAGTKRNVPLFVVGGILIALFGIPLGFGGLGVLDTTELAGNEDLRPDDHKCMAPGRATWRTTCDLDHCRSWTPTACPGPIGFAVS